MENKHWTENFRIFTPILVTIACFMLGNLISTTNKIDDKLFKHLTNDEVHAPRSQTVSKIEFDAHCKEKDKIIDRIYAELTCIRQELQRLK